VLLELSHWFLFEQRLSSAFAPAAHPKFKHNESVLQSVADAVRELTLASAWTWDPWLDVIEICVPKRSMKVPFHLLILSSS